MSAERIWYIPGWGVGKTEESALTRELTTKTRLRTIWLPDYGQFEQNPRRMYAPHLLELLHQEEEPVVLVGWSLGAMIALELAANAPKKVKTLTLISATARFWQVDPSVETEKKPFGPLAPFLEGKWPSHDANSYRRFFLTCYHPARPKPEILDEKVRAALDTNRDQLRLGLEYLRRADLREAAKDILIPTALAHGNADAVIPVTATIALANLLPRSRLYIFEKLGHMLPELAAKRLADVILHTTQQV